MANQRATARLFSTPDQEPFEQLEVMRAQGPVLWDDELGGWLVLSYDLCRSIFTDEATFAHYYAEVDDDTLEIKGGRNLVVIQGPEHNLLHRWAIQLFSQKNIEIYTEEHIRPVVSALVDAFAADGRADLRQQLCNPVPGRTMMSMMDMAWADDAFVQRVVDLHETIMVYLGKTRAAASAEDIRNAKAASHALNEILLPIIRERRGGTGTDLLSRLWAEAPTILPDFDEQLMLANSREFFLGGFDTTVHALSNGLYILLTQPEVRAAVDADRGTAMEVFLEEVMRTLGVIQNRTRIATKDVQLGDVAVKQGERVIPVLLAANRDPAKWGACPAHVDLQRQKPREHLGYIAGPRTCPGAPLARAEMRVVFETVLDRLKNVRLDPDAEAPRFMGSFTRSYRPLNVLFDPN